MRAEQPQNPVNDFFTMAFWRSLNLANNFRICHKNASRPIFCGKEARLFRALHNNSESSQQQKG